MFETVLININWYQETSKRLETFTVIYASRSRLGLTSRPQEVGALERQKYWSAETWLLSCWPLRFQIGIDIQDGFCIINVWGKPIEGHR